MKPYRIYYDYINKKLNRLVGSHTSCYNTLAELHCALNEAIYYYEDYHRLENIYIFKILEEL